MATQMFGNINLMVFGGGGEAGNVPNFLQEYLFEIK